MGLRVVVLDDDPGILRSLELVLQALGHEVSVHDDPLEACLEIVRRPPPDVVLLDFMMPELTGKEVLARIRGHLAPDCRIIFITGHTDRLDESGLGWKGPFTVLPKPLDLDVLVEVVGGSPSRP